MKKYLCGFIILFVTIHFYPQEAFAKDGLYYSLDGRRVYMADVIIEEGVEGYAHGAALKEMILGKLSRRAFTRVDKEEMADIVITCRVLEYDFLKEDPIDHIYFPLTAMFDAFSRNNYLRIKTRMTVSSKEGKVLWRKPVLGTITRKDITPEGQYQEINKRLATVFIRECFSKGKSRK